MVRVIEDPVFLRELQRGHGEWSEGFLMVCVGLCTAFLCSLSVVYCVVFIVLVCVVCLFVVFSVSCLFCVSFECMLSYAYLQWYLF